MSRTGRPAHDRLLELMAGRALGDLSPAELAELNELADPATREALAEQFELTAAAVDRWVDAARSLPVRTENSALPDSVRQAIIAQARRHPTFDSKTTQRDFEATSNRPAQRDGVDIGQADILHAAGSSSAILRETRPTSHGGSRWREALAWFAFAASALVALGLWARRDPSPPGTIDLATARAQLLQTETDLVQAEFGPGKTPFESDVRGDVVWSNARQRGFLRFRGMPVNDPGREQYQLWIIDPERDDEPIDGGVFNIESAAEAIIPIDAKLQVVRPQAFAITIEKPGGVVVSTQARLPLLAAVQSQ